MTAIFYSLWIIGTLLAWKAIHCVVKNERLNPATGLTNGVVVGVIAASMLPFLNVVMAFLLYQSFPSYFRLGDWWGGRSIYKAPVDAEEE